MSGSEHDHPKSTQSEKEADTDTVTCTSGVWNNGQNPMSSLEGTTVSLEEGEAKYEKKKKKDQQTEKRKET